ncbi:MAG: ABC transporter ATP-binding protein [Aeromicrobium sp.]
MTMIQLRNLSRAGAKGMPPLLDSISLAVPSGSSLAIVGPRNSGKSLLLRTIVGLEYPSDGEILMDGALVNAVDPRDRDIAMVFQDYEIYPHLNVFDNIAFSATLRKGFDKTALSDRVYEVAEILGLGDLLEDGAKPKDLDESERQKVALARVLVRDASAYLFDDALSAHDDRTRSQIRSLTLQWQREQERTSIYVTSDVAEALSLGDQVAVMHQGYLHQVGTPRDLYEHPANLFVAAFVGAPAMNLIPAKLRGNSLQLPFLTLPLDEAMQQRTQGRELLVVGIRPEDCEDAAGLTEEQLRGKIVFSTKIDEIEWRGRSQYAYLGFDIDESTEILLEEVERQLEFDLFQAFLLAEISAESDVRAGMFLKVAVDSQKIHVFDPATGENLTIPGSH